MGTFTFSTPAECLLKPRAGWNGRSEWEARLERCAHTQGMASPGVPEWVGREGDCPRLAQDRTLAHNCPPQQMLLTLLYALV